jgi:hypothetical protein
MVPLMQNLTTLRSFKIALCACAALLAGAPAFAQHVHVGYAGGWHGGYGWRGGYYGGYHGGYYGGWHGGYYGWRGYYGWPGYTFGPWGWWGGYGPYYYSSYGWGGAPYWNGAAGQYESAAPPEGIASQGESTAGPSQPVIYPKNGQSEEQQGKDAFECHRWAVGQTGFDPTQGAPGNRSAYLRAQAACLEGRGYTVK